MSERLVLLRELVIRQMETLAMFSMDGLKQLPGGNGKRKCFDETLSSIENLRKKYKVVIGSTTDNNPLYQDLERNKLAVDEIYTSEMIRKYKPDPEFYHYILRKEKCNKEDAVFVGDSYADDICGPGKVGMKTILIDRKHNFHCEKNEFRPWKITDSLENIMELVSE